VVVRSYTQVLTVDSGLGKRVSFFRVVCFEVKCLVFFEVCVFVCFLEAEDDRFLDL